MERSSGTAIDGVLPVGAGRLPRRLRVAGVTTILCLVSACVSGGPSAWLAAPAPLFSPIAFFTGRTVGDGSLHVLLSHRRAVHVAGNGRIDPDGTLILSQRVAEAGKPPRDRVWHLRAVGPARFAGTLSDARGPVTADVVGNRLHLRFTTAAGGLAVEQWIYLQPGRQIALNRMVVRKLGVPVASLRETIRRVP